MIETEKVAGHEKYSSKKADSFRDPRNLDYEYYAYTSKMNGYWRIEIFPNDDKNAVRWISTGGIHEDRLTGRDELSKFKTVRDLKNVIEKQIEQYER